MFEERSDDADRRRDRFRVFVSYARDEWPLAKKLIEAVANEGLHPLWDRAIRPGVAFTDAIKGLISHAHVFMPLITKESQNHPWVHQETGYAIARDIPVLPVAVDTTPEVMIAQLQAIVVQSDLEDISEKLRKVDFDRLVCPPPPPPTSIVEIAEWPERRADLMAQYAQRVTELGGAAVVRQRGAFSSFCLPDKNLGNPVWRLRDGALPRSEYCHYLQREERRALEHHAFHCGCYLVIDPTLKLETLGLLATMTRLYTLLDFLVSMNGKAAWVVASPRAQPGSLTLVGDWFVAESLVPGVGGYRQTVFNWHAPTALRASRHFQRQFEELIGCAEPTADETRENAIKEIVKNFLEIDGGDGVRQEEAALDDACRLAIEEMRGTVHQIKKDAGA